MTIMTPKISLQGIVFFKEPNEYGFEGYARYHVDGDWEFNVDQPFWSKESSIVENHNVWHFNGNRESVSLTPSFLCDTGRFKIHLYLTNGKIELCGDSTVEL